MQVVVQGPNLSTCNAATQSWDNVHARQNSLALLRKMPNENAEVDAPTPWGESELGDS